METQRNKWPISALAGILVITIYSTFTLISWALFPVPASPVTHWLSDFGSSTKNPAGAIFYNLGCILTGTMLFPFYLGLYVFYSGVKWRKLGVIITQILGVISAFCDVMIGIFPEDQMMEHMFWSRQFFLFNLLVLIVGIISILRDDRFIKPIALYGAPVVVCNLVFVLNDFAAGMKWVEWFVVFSALGFVALITANMLKMRDPSWKYRGKKPGI